MKLDCILPRINSSESYLFYRWVAFIAGCVVALLAISSDAFKVIGRDSVFYIQTAAVYNQFGFKAAFQVYLWPAYTIAIASVHNLTGLTLVNSAHLINLLFVLLMTDSFCRIYWLLFPKSKILWLPIVVFLAYTGINDYRNEIIRGWGFWAFGLLSLVYFLKSYNQARLSDFLLWQVCVLVACLFRLEALALVVLLPILFLINKWQIIKFLKASSIFLCGSFFLWLYLSLYDDINPLYWWRLKQVIPFITVLDLWAEFKQESLEQAHKIFSLKAKDHALVFMVSGLLGVLLTKVVTKVGFGYLLITIVGWYKSSIVMQKREFYLILFFLFVAFFPVIVFFAKTRILSGRYLIFTVLILLLLVTYYFEQLIIYCLDNKKHILLGGLVCLILLNLIFGLVHSKVDRIYLKDIGLWTDQNIPKQARVLANNTRLCFYSNRQPRCHRYAFNGEPLGHDFLQNYDYLLWQINGQDKQINNLLLAGNLKWIHVLDGTNPGTYAVLYKIKKH